MSFPEKFIIDTNVPRKANDHNRINKISKDEAKCVQKCIEFISYVIKNCDSGGLVIDNGDHILKEYRRQLSMSGEPGVGDHFLKWVYTNIGKFPQEDRVTITPQGDSFIEFPPINIDVDIQDKKFFAVSYAHPSKPIIAEAADAKWLNWKDEFEKFGIEMLILCPEYMKNKLPKKNKHA